MYDMKKKKHTDNGTQETMYTCDGSRNEMAQPVVDVPVVENNEYPVGMKPQVDTPKY